MKDTLHVGDQKIAYYTVLLSDVAAFQGAVVHQVCATFTLAREIEWATRQFMLEWWDDDEEGIGTFLSIDHKSPAFVGEELTITSTIEAINGNELICSYLVEVGARLVASGKTGQKILKKEKINRLLSGR